MKYPILSIALTSLILGCSSGSAINNSARFKTMTGGQSAGDSTSFYWYTEQMESPYSAADFVSSGEYGWYKTDYRWREGVVKEIVREGEQLKEEDELLPYKVHLRFNKDGEAVYQQYRLDGKVLPMTPEQIAHVASEAESLKKATKKQERDGYELIQGYWDGETFNSCSGEEFDDHKLEFNQTLPSFVVNRLSRLDNYVAFVGSTSPGTITVRDLLMLEDDDYDCIERPALIESD